MKILALADIHMGAGAAYADDRLADQLKVLEQVVQIAFDEDVSLVLIAGDAFHRPRPTPATLLAFRKFTDALAVLQVPTIAILGNAGHDQEGVDRPCALDLFESRWFRVSRRPELIWDFVDGVNVVTLPSVPVSRLVSQSDSVARGPIFDQASEALLAIATELRRDAGSDKPAVMLGHWSVSGASLPNGLPVDTLGEPILDLASLERLNYDAIVLGHLHRWQNLQTGVDGVRKPIFYCGSAMVTDFGDAGFDHGCVILDTDTGTYTFRILNDRPFVTLEYDCDSPTDMEMLAPEGSVLGWALEGIEDAVVRVKYRATEEQHRRINTAELKRRILDAGAHRVFQISADIVKVDRVRVAGVDENLDPAAALDAWMLANDVEANREGLSDLLARYSVTA